MANLFEQRLPLGIRDYVEDVQKNGPRPLNDIENMRIQFELKRQLDYWGQVESKKRANNVERANASKMFEYTHLHLRRFHGASENTYECIWIEIKPEDIDGKAKLFNSYYAFRKCLLEGKTVLVAGGGQWNLLLKSDVILGKLTTTKTTVSIWEMNRRGLDISQKLNIL